MALVVGGENPGKGVIPGKEGNLIMEGGDALIRDDIGEGDPLIRDDMGGGAPLRTISKLARGEG